MTPSLPDILVGNFLCMIDPPPPEQQGEFMAGKVAVVALLSLLAAQEAERGIAARVAENAAIQAVLSEASGDYALEAVAGTEDLSLTALDAANARLRQALIRLHEAVEESGDAARHHAILRLYARMAELRRLDMPPLPGR
ncbi:hypothetical protein B7G68_07585 [Caulobacter segnis]|uniref:Uncharacterized protein n=2 Tax=Caulobacter segnis TaxID=88688 RepID=D5VFW5_CAUST|nr:hypothetical protein [Caulobacter segnis]ADG09968.1 conserved hypothetical protein [Caulobacter segnis ATCC 21756]AVQ01722.1 hypothetical protein B7G68_07585 [Caulobacter segnis]